MTATPTVGSTFFGLDLSLVTTRLLSLRRRISKRVLLLEFGPASLMMAEATLMQSGVQLSHISSFSLPPEALDRGVPVDPLKMAGLIQDFCAEKKIPAHRVAVVLPPELAFQRLLDLPATLTTEEAREYVLNPANGLQIPFPLTQTDFDLFPVYTPTEAQQVGGKRLYMLTAIPEVLVDPIVEMLQVADLELQLLELGSHSQLRNHAADLITLAPQQVDLVLELLPDCSNLMLVSCSGLLGSERLAAIRSVPDVDLESEQQEVAIDSGLIAEDILFKDENYLPLSELDLRVLLSDLRASFERFHLKLPGAQIRRLILTGVNSSHPLLTDLLGELLGLNVVLSRSEAVTGLGGLSMDGLLPQSGLGRLTGLALGLLPNDQLLACSLEVQKLVEQNSCHSNNAVAIADLLSSSEAQTGLDLVAVEVKSKPAIEDHKDNDGKLICDTDSADQPAHLNDSPASSYEAEELTSLLETPLSLDEASLKDALKETQQGSLIDHGELPSSVHEVELSLDHEIVEDADSSEEQLSSLKATPVAQEDQTSFEAVNASLDIFPMNVMVGSDEITSRVDASTPETEWPSIASIEQNVPISGQDIQTQDDILDWPSIDFEKKEEVVDLAVVEDPAVSTLNPRDHLEELESDQLMDSIVLEQPTQSQQSSSEYFGQSSLSEESTADQNDEYQIPDLNISDQAIQGQQPLVDDEETASDNLDSSEDLEDLGELRFANDDS